MPFNFELMDHAIFALIKWHAQSVVSWMNFKVCFTLSIVSS